MQTVHGLIKEFKKEGYLKDTPGSHDKGFSRKGVSKYTAERSQAQITKMYKCYFDPMTNIAHHVWSCRLNSQ